MAIVSIDQVNLEGKKVLARFDFNTPLGDVDADGVRTITDSTRVDLALPTIKALLEQNVSKLILMSHLGRPKGEVKKELSLEPVALYLAEKLNTEVVLSESATDSGLKTLLGLNHIKIILLENLRFHPEETEDNDAFAEKLASYADVYVNDAFGAAHRKHASVHKINKYFNRGERFAGLLLRNEIEALTKITNKPKKPFVAVIGGAKVSDKIKTIEKLLVNVDNLLIGGAMAYPFLKAKGHNIGKSLCSDEDVTLAKSLINQDRGKKILLPVDHRVAQNPDSQAENTDSEHIPDDQIGFDIGERTEHLFASKIKEAKTVLWNGPMGFFEKPAFNKGTFAIAKALSESKGFTLVGGGDSVAAVNQSGYADKISHISSGSGASLEFLEKGNLPGIQALSFGLS